MKNGVREILYETKLGRACVADALGFMPTLPDVSVNLIMTSPPYALHFKKEYGNRDKHAYVDWFLPFAAEIFRVLAKDGSFVLNIGGSYNKGLPTRSLYHFELLIALVRQTGFHLPRNASGSTPPKCRCRPNG